LSRIAVLHHRKTTQPMLSQWAISELSRVWEEDGVEVLHIAGTTETPEADVLIVHVDLSVVPDEYLSFAARYPKVVNGRVKDIRKSVISRHLVRSNDGWSGPVIVKSNLNCAGRGELVTGHKPWELFPFPIRRQADYRVYESAKEVPSEYFGHPQLVVERFLPEREGDLYFARSYHFVGDISTTVRLGSKQPIVLGHTSESVEEIEPHSEVIGRRRELGMDYGKIDYVVHDGKVVILDVNKTTGAGGVSKDPKVIELRRRRARGVYSFLPGGAP
jgi:hypothetical protein